jgi:hypothetical protein
MGLLKVSQLGLLAVMDLMSIPGARRSDDGVCRDVPLNRIRSAFDGSDYICGEVDGIGRDFLLTAFLK